MSSPPPPLPHNGSDNNDGDAMYNNNINIPPQQVSLPPGADSREGLLREWLTRRIQLVHTLRQNQHQHQMAGNIGGDFRYPLLSGLTNPGGMLASNAFQDTLQWQRHTAAMSALTAAAVAGNNLPATTGIPQNQQSAYMLSPRRRDMLMQNIAMHAPTMQQPQPHAMGLGLGRHGLAGLHDREHYQPAEYNDEGGRGYRENNNEGYRHEGNNDGFYPQARQQSQPEPPPPEPQPANSPGGDALQEALKKKIMQKIQDKLRKMNPDITETEQARAMEHLLQEQQSGPGPQQQQQQQQQQMMPPQDQDLGFMGGQQQKQQQPVLEGQPQQQTDEGEMERQKMLDALYKSKAVRRSSSQEAPATGESSGPPEEISFPCQEDKSPIDLAGNYSEENGGEYEPSTSTQPTKAALEGPLEDVRKTAGEEAIRAVYRATAKAKGRTGDDGQSQSQASTKESDESEIARKIGEAMGVATIAAAQAIAKRRLVEMQSKPKDSAADWAKTAWAKRAKANSAEALAAKVKAQLKSKIMKDQAQANLRANIATKALSSTAVATTLPIGSTAQLRANTATKAVSSTAVATTLPISSTNTTIHVPNRDGNPLLLLPPAKKKRKVTKEERAKKISTKLNEIIESLQDENMKSTILEDRENIQSRRTEQRQMYEDQLREMEARLSMYTKLEGLAEQISELQTQSKAKNSSESYIEGAMDMIHSSLKNYRMLEETSDRIMGIDVSLKQSRK